MTFERRVELVLIALAAVVALVVIAMQTPNLVLYNASPSVPTGFYIRSDAEPSLGAFVTVRARDVAPAYAQQRDFIDAGDRFIKRVAAMPGATVCAEGNRITIDGVRVAERVAMDSAGRTLPSWSGCRTLQDEVFLLGDTPDSFDGRYWGPVALSTIEGVWQPLHLTNE